MKKSSYAAAVCSALVLSLGLATANAQESVSASTAEGLNLYFVELNGKPIADGNSLANVRSEKSRFQAAAARAGVRFTQRRSYDTLFNGYAVAISAADRAKLAGVAGVKAIWPIERIDGPVFEPDTSSSPNLETAIAMTHADIVQNSLGYRGTGIKVAVMDTGIDYDNPDLGGDGVQRSNSTVFPTARVTGGWDFVGDDFDFDRTPVPDPYPDDCNGHGSHVAGIVGASGTVTGVAPDVTFNAYRVFGCSGSTTSDIMLAAMERAFADGNNVLNMSIGARAQWPQYPTAEASSRLVKRGMVVVASIGNNGPGGSVPDGPWAAGAPGVGANVIGSASYDNSHVKQPAFQVTPDGRLVGYSSAAGAPATPTSGSYPLTRIGTPTTTDDGCAALPAGSQTGNVVLIRRGTCGFFVKATNAQNAGAAGVVLYNNVAGFISPTVAGAPPITIPVVAITAADGVALNGLLDGGAVTLSWTGQLTVTPNPTGGLISGFSSFGMAADLTLKPDLGAPGGSIYSTIPLELGGHGLNSGTSMSSPHIAGAAALLLQAKRGRQAYPAHKVRDRLQNSANPTNWSGNPTLGLLDYTVRQGAGLLDIDAAILAPVDVVPGKLNLGESEAGPQVRTLTISNPGNSAVTLDLSHVAALTVGPKNPANFAAVSAFASDASASFSANPVVVPARGSATVNVTINPATTNSAPAQSQYGGYIVLTPQGGGDDLSVPYAGFIGDYQSLAVLTPTVNGFPWLAKLAAGTFTNQPSGATYTLVGDDVPQILFHLDHHAQQLEISVTGTNGQSYHYISNDTYVGRSLSAAGFFVQAWDGTTFRGTGASQQNFVVPDGDYRVTIRVTKALGTRTNPAHVETWVSPIITIDRP